MVRNLTFLGGLDSQYAEKQEGLKLDLACGGSLRDGYLGVDYLPLDELVAKTDRLEGDVLKEYEENYKQVNLFEFPWPFEDNSVAATFSSHFVEHIPHYIPGTDPAVDGWWMFFEELYRVLEDGGIAEFIHPFSRSDRAFWDPTHTRYIHYQTWGYLNKEHRDSLGVNHYSPKVDFDILSVQTIHEPTLLEGRSEEVIEFARQFYFNITDDLFVVLKANK